MKFSKLSKEHKKNQNQFQNQFCLKTVKIDLFLCKELTNVEMKRVNSNK